MTSTYVLPMKSDNFVRTSPKRSASVASITSGSEQREKSKRYEVCSWKECFNEPWYRAPFRLFNTVVPGATDYLREGAKEKYNNLKNENRLKLTENFAKSEVFVSCLESKNFQHLSTVVEAAAPPLKQVDFEDISREEKDYLWINIFWQ